MDWKKFFDNDDEKPLDNLISDGGFFGIFKTVACIGDSLASGEMESKNAEGIIGYHDYNYYAWSRYMTDMVGSKLYNFSRGGMTAKEFRDSYAAKVNAFDEKNLCQCYIIALGVNDINNIKLGSIDDINLREHRKNNEETFADYYDDILKTIKSKQPDAKIFVVTIPRGGHDDGMEELRDNHAKILHGFAEKYKNVYVIDLRKYGPVYDDEFRSKFFMGGHLNAMGYVLSAKMIVSYIDYIIRKNPEDFVQTGFIGTLYENTDYNK